MGIDVDHNNNRISKIDTSSSSLSSSPSISAYKDYTTYIGSL